MKHLFKSILISVLATALFTSCFTSTTTAGSVGADRNQIMLYSEAQMNQAAEQQYSEVIAEAKKAGTLNKNASTYKRVQNIANKLIAQTSVYRNDATSWDWEVNVITDSTINAWCMPGGKIVVYTGIIDSLKLTDGELAAIMGHEISHALKEHSREQASREVLTQLGVGVVSSAFGMGQEGQNALAIGAQLGLTLPFSRSNETEADNMGTELMARAGYNPYEAANVWKKMDSISGDSVPQFLSTHPSNESRFANLNQIAAKVYPLYEAAKK